MDHRIRSWLLTGWALSVVGILALNVLWPLPGRQEEWPWVVGLMAFPVAAALVLARRPGNPVGRVLGTIGTAAGVIFLTSWYAMTYPDAALSRPAEVLDNVAVGVQFAALLALLHLFPTGRAVGPWHGRLLRVLLWTAVAVIALHVVKPGPLPLTGRPNPFGIAPAWTVAVDAFTALLLPLVALLGVVVLVARRRRAGTVERAQLDWFFAAAGLVLVMLVMITVAPQGQSPAIEALAGLFIVVAFWSPPAAVVIAITRYRLYEIDRVVSRTATYTVVALVLGLGYALSVIGLQAIVPLGGSELAVAASTLIVATAFAPLRTWVQRRLDRRFNRARFQAGQVIEQFAQRRREEVDLHLLVTDLSGVVRSTMQPEAVSVWLRDRV